MNVSKFSIQKMLAITAIAMAIPMSAQANPQGEGSDAFPHAGHEHHRHHGGMGFLKQLDLTPAQESQVKAIMAKQKNEMRAAMDERRAHKADMKALVEQEVFDEPKAARLIEDQQARERASRLSMLRSQHEIYKVLTPEQRAKAHTIRAEWQDRKKQRMDERKNNSQGNAM